MSRPKLQDAVLLVIENLYAARSQAARIEDVTRGVARVYDLPEQLAGQLVEKTRIGMMGAADEKVCLRDVVKSSAVSLRNHGYTEIGHGYDLIWLTPAGSAKAKHIARDQWIVDAGVINRIKSEPVKRTHYPMFDYSEVTSSHRKAAPADWGAQPAPADRGPQAAPAVDTRPKPARGEPSHVRGPSIDGPGF